MGRSTVGRTAALTLLALVAFAGNSILCRMALLGGGIDPLRFSALRLASGALVLSPVLLRGPRAWSPRGAAALWVYAVCFSLAYVSLDTGTGALLLFGAVQVTMTAAAALGGERPSGARLAGIAVAFAGVVWLCLPGASAPSPTGALLMAAAGVAWGVYSLLGRTARSPTARTAANFALAGPLALPLWLLAEPDAATTTSGALLAVASGALTSGLGYAVWYAALPGHTATSAAVVQLSVPVLAAAGGAALVGEAPTGRLIAASVPILGGIALTVLAGRTQRATDGDARDG